MTQHDTLTEADIERYRSYEEASGVSRDAVCDAARAHLSAGEFDRATLLAESLWMVREDLTHIVAEIDKDLNYSPPPPAGESEQENPIDDAELDDLLDSHSVAPQPGGEERCDEPYCVRCPNCGWEHVNFAHKGIATSPQGDAGEPVYKAAAALSGEEHHSEQECKHEAWEDLAGGGRRCADCRVYMPSPQGDVGECSCQPLYNTHSDGCELGKDGLPYPDIAGVKERLRNGDATNYGGDLQALLNDALRVIEGMERDLAIKQGSIELLQECVLTERAEAQAKCERLEAEIAGMDEILTAERKNYDNAFHSWTEAQATIARLTVALEWYADPIMYVPDLAGKPNGVSCDKGWRARAAIQGRDGE